MLVLYSSEFINGNYIGRTLNPWKAHLCRIGSGVEDINDALKWFLYPGCYSFLLNRILAPEDLALKTLHAFQTLSLMTFNVSVLQASQERPVLLVSMLVRSSNEVDEDRFIHLGVVSFVVVDEFEEGIRWLGKWPTKPILPGESVIPRARLPACSHRAGRLNWSKI